MRTSNPIEVVPLSKYHAVEEKRRNEVKLHAFLVSILWIIKWPYEVPGNFQTEGEGWVGPASILNTAVVKINVPVPLRLEIRSPIPYPVITHK
jgi:hypothetical protein